MATPTAKAQALSERVDAAEKETIDRWNATMAAQPDPAWGSMYSVEEIERRQAAKRDTEKKSILSTLNTLGVTLQREYETVRVLVEKSLRPLLFSNLTIEQEAGRAYEERANRMLRSIGPLKVGNEYAWAMSNKLFDYASELLRWAELVADPQDPEEVRFVAELKTKHIAALGLEQSIADRDLLEQKVAQLAHRIALVESDAGNLFTWSQLNSLTAAEMRAAGIDLVNRSMALHHPPLTGR
jgi:hypothetical protein